MQKFLSLLFSRRALAIVGVVMLALLVWFIGPLVAFDTLHPLVSVSSRGVAIVLLLMLLILWLVDWSMSIIGVTVLCLIIGFVSPLLAFGDVRPFAPLWLRLTLIGLILTMICCIILGMGVPTTANYCIMASTCVPILIKMGYPLVAAHFFVFYFGIVADITPPVALAAYAGSAIAKSNPMKTGINATKLAIAAFIVPFIFAYNPQMLFENVTSVFQVIQIVITALLGIFAVAAGLEGYILRTIHWPLRELSVIGGLTLLIPGTVSDLIGLVIVAGIIALQIVQNKKAARETA